MNKFRAIRTHCGKHSHPSRGEADLCVEFQWCEKAGTLKILKNQPNVFVTEARIRIIHDWLIHRLDKDEIVYVDFKGFDSQSWKRNRKLWTVYGDHPLEVWRKNGKGFFMSEKITPKGGIKNDKD